MKKRPIYYKLLKRIKEDRKFIQVLLGPRQVGKTTLVNQLEEELKISVNYITADIATLEDLLWLRTQWEVARQKAKAKKKALLIIDEVQKNPNWSNMIKKLWDEDTRSGKSFEEAKVDKEFWGRLVESTVGAYLLNEIRGPAIELYYWREKNKEVDSVLKKGSKITAIEVKSSIKKEKLSGLTAFSNAFNPSLVLVVGKQGIQLEEFLSHPIDNWI